MKASAPRIRRRGEETFGRTAVRTLLLPLLLGLSTGTLAQIPSPLSLLEPKAIEEPQAAAPLSDLEKERAEVDARLREATGQLNEASAAADAPAAERTNEETQSLQEGIDLLKARIQVARRHLDVIDEATAMRAERAEQESAASRWTGFPDPPPYPLDLAEDLAKTLERHEAEIETDELRLASFTQSKGLVQEELTSGEKTFRQTLEALESARSDETKTKARRRHELTQLALRATGEGLDFVRASEQFYTEKLSLEKRRAELARNKLRRALLDVRWAPDQVQTRIASLDREIRSATSALSVLAVAETAATQQIDRLTERLNAQKAHGDLGPLLNLERQLRQEQLAAIRATQDDVNLRIGYVQTHQAYWSALLALHQDWDFAKAKETLEEIETSLGVVEQGIAAFNLVRAEIDDFALDQRFADPELTAPRRALRQSVEERGKQAAVTQASARRFRGFLTLWKQEIELRGERPGVATQVQAWDDVARDEAKRLWSFELFSVEDSLTVDGQRIVEKRPVTIGKVIEAVLILAIGLPLASALARWLSYVRLPFSASTWQRRLLLQKLLSLGIIALVVVLALVTVKIPLAALAFLGGAIALGIGFGAKNLLNNFISGFILLGEGTVRPGDWIEIDGNRGVVQRIGERSTRVRRFDGVHLLIPNSHFLESTVTNLTLSDRRLRIDIQVGVAYGSPSRAVESLLLEIARANPLVVADPPPVVVFEDFGDSALIFRLYAWIDLEAQPDFRTVVTELRHCMGERFAERGLTIPFPQRDLHLRPDELLAARMPHVGEPRGETTAGAG